jgi:hypothetical protein
MANYLRNSLFAVLLLGCYSPRKAEKQLDKAAKYPDKVAVVCHNMFPVQVKTDTVENTEYDFIEIEGQDRYITVDNFKTDTVVKYVTRKIEVPAKVITITNTVKDSAEIYKLGLDLKACKKSAEVAEAKTAVYLKIAKISGAIVGLLLLAILATKPKDKQKK